MPFQTPIAEKHSLYLNVYQDITFFNSVTNTSTGILYLLHVLVNLSKNFT